MGIVFVSELEEVNTRLGWKHPLNDEQQELLRLIVLCERYLEKENPKGFFSCYECYKRVNIKITKKEVEKHRMGKHLFCLDCITSKEKTE